MTSTNELAVGSNSKQRKQNKKDSDLGYMIMNSPFVETNLQSYLTFLCDNALKTFGELREELRTDLELHLKIKGENNMIAGMPWIINKETTGASITVDCKDI